jgi:hypothetical protein
MIIGSVIGALPGWQSNEGDGELRHGIEDRFRDRVFSAVRFAERDVMEYPALDAEITPA